MPEQWTANAERTWEPVRMVGEDDLGRLPYLRSRLRNELVLLESGPECPGGDA